MKHRLLGKIASVSFIVFLVGVIGTFTVGGTNAFFDSNDDSVTRHDSVALDGAESAEVELDFGVGEANVSGGAKNLMEATFNYSKDFGPPEIDYKIHNSVGELKVEQETDNKFGFINFDFDLGFHDEDEYRWDIQLNDEVPIDLKVGTGVSSSYLDLSDINLSSLKVDAGVGDSTIDLSGAYKQSFDVKVNSGVGSFELILPKDVGVRVNVDKGVGDVDADGFRIDKSYYVNDQYGKSEVTINIDIDMGVGDVDLEMR